MPAKDIRSVILRDLMDNLRVWPRLEASKTAGEWDESIYRHVWSEKRLSQLSEITGNVYPTWGSSFEIDENGTRKTKWVGFDSNGTCIPVGLRWTETYDDWKSRHEANSEGGRNRKPTNDPDWFLLPRNGKRIRHIVGEMWRPQIVCTIRPLALYKKWRSGPFLVKSGNGWAFNRKKIMDTSEWKKRHFTILPLCFYLRIIGRVKPDLGTRGHGYEERGGSLALVTGGEDAAVSRHVDDDKEFLEDEDFAQKLAEDWENVEQRERFCRDLHNQFVKKFGYGEW